MKKVSEGTTLRASEIRRLIPKRPRDAHKGSNGHVLIVAGSRGMGGAAILSTLGALKAGAGLVTLAIIRSERPSVVRRVPEAMTLPLPETPAGSMAKGALKVIRAFVRRRTITTLAIGPGLSAHPGVLQVVKEALKLGIPAVIDADAILALRSLRRKLFPGCVMTPHPGELSRLLEKSRQQIKRERIQSAAGAARKFGLICVLKGHHTVISDGHAARLNPTGNPAMATGGMGDVLTGVIAAFMAQGLGAYQAACVGVYLHGLAGDLARKSDRGLLASELALQVPNALRRLLSSRHKPR